MRAPLCALALLLPLGAWAAGLRVLYVSEGSGAGSSLLRPQLERRGLAVRAAEEPAAVSREALAGYRAALIDCETLRVDARLAATLLAFAARGGGLVFLRSSDCFAAGNAASDLAGASFTGQPRPETRAFRFEWAEARHALAAAAPRGFLTADRVGARAAPLAGARVLARAGDDRAPLLWALARGKGRIVHTEMGADPAVLNEAAFAAVIGGALEWAAGQPLAAAPPDSAHAAPSGVRALVVTGGHTYDPSFYAVLEGMEGVAVTVDPHPRPYRSGDLRKRTDVLVLYDSMQEIDERERRNLMDFVAAGKGIVLLHHALVDYCNWQWWYDEVTGGRWHQTEDKPPRWKTTWKHGVEQIVRPTVPHPVTRGVGVMHLWDETYKGMWFSPRNQVLMRSEDPSSDGPVVWIGPCSTSRVVGIELGHDRMAHLHPGYRRLVRNAILWSAGKLE